MTQGYLLVSRTTVLLLIGILGFTAAAQGDEVDQSPVWGYGGVSETETENAKDGGSLDTSALRRVARSSSNDVAFDADAPPKASYQLSPKLFFGGDLEIEYTKEGNFDVDDEAADDLMTLEPEAELVLFYQASDRLSGFLNLLLSREFEVRNEQPDGDPPTRLRVNQAYVGFSDIVRHTDVYLGRQRLEDEREWVYDANLDGIRVVHEGNTAVLDASATRVRLIDQDLLNDQRNEPINNYYFGAAMQPNDDAILGAYILVRDDRSGEEGRPIFLGLRALGETDFDLEYWAEGALLRGRGEELRDSSHDDLRGYGFDIGATYVIDVPLEPSLTLGYAYGSGDEDTGEGTNKNFQQSDLQDNNDRFNGVTSFKYYGELFDPELSNLRILTAGFGIRPSKNTSIDLVYHNYRQVEAVDEIRDTDIEPDPTGLSNSLGDEIDIIFGLRRWGGIDLELVLGRFEPGSAFGPDADPAHLINIEAQYTF